MAIANICKLNLVAMAYDKDKILNALQRTNAVEIKSHKETEYATVPTSNDEELRAYLTAIESALSVLTAETERYEKLRGIKSVKEPDLEVRYSEFMSAKDRKEEIDAVVKEINRFIDEKQVLKATLQKGEKLLSQLAVYSGLKTPFSCYSDTRSSRIRLGVIPINAKQALETAFSSIELADYEILNETEKELLLCVVFHKSAIKETEEALSLLGFSATTYASDETGEEKFQTAKTEVENTKRALEENADKFYALKDKIKPLKIYYDYLLFALEKEELSNKLLKTERTFLLEAFVPEDEEEKIRTAIENVTDTVFMEFSPLSENEDAPTLLRNNRLVENFEGITNTYSAPNYREFDPNTVMAFFYSLFMGFIIGDAGYGVLMLGVGWYLWYQKRKKPTGMSRLAAVFAVGGVFALLWGALFNSFFGFTVLPYTVMPNPQTDQWSLLGINVPSVLLISLEVGIVQLLVGYLCKAVQEWRRGRFWDGVFDGVVWAIFSVGVGLAIVGFIDQANLPILGTIGGIIAGVSLLVAMVTAGRHEKFFGKITKGFGTAYGIINYASDILSYARLYGLMLSGAVIAQIVSTYGGQFVASGQIPMIVLGVVLFVVGHGFNLIMNLLGAYIHDARLQYVEFYGRFYEGEGRLFKSLGSSRKYTSLVE